MTTAAFSLGVGAHLAALAILAVQVCVGARLLGWLGLRDSLRTHEQVLFGWAAGFSLTTLAFMLLVGSGALGPVSVLVVLALCAAVSFGVSRELAVASWRALRTLDLAMKVSVGLGIVALGFWVWPHLLETLLPNSDWDSALYHLPLAEHYLEGSLWGRDPYFPAFSFPGAVHLLYAALLALGLESAITPLNFHLTVLLLLCTVAVAGTIGGRSASIWAAVAFTTTPILWQLGVDPRIDGFLCLAVMLAVYALVSFVKCGRDEHLKLAALALGVAIGCKYTALPFVLAIFAVGLAFRLLGKNGQQGARRLAPLLATSALLLAIPNGAWYAANLAIHGDPLFPLLRGNYIVSTSGERIRLARADEEEAEAHLQDPAIKERLRSFENIRVADPPTHLFDLVDLLRNPDRYSVKPNHGIGPLLLLSLALPLVLRRSERRRPALIVWALAWGGYALLGSQTNLLRYAAPVLPMLAATTGLLIARVPVRAIRIVIGIAALVLLVRDYQTEERKLQLLRPDLALTAQPSIWRDDAARIRWLKQVGYNFTPPMAYATEQIDALLASGRMPKSSVVMMVGEGKGRLLDCDFLPDSSWFAHRFVGELRNAGLDHAMLAEGLRAKGVTHVLYNRDYYTWVISETQTARSRLAFALIHLEDFLDRYGTLLFEGAGMQLFALRGGDGDVAR